MTVTTPPPGGPAPAAPAAQGAAAPDPAGPRSRGTAPARLQVLMIILLLASLAWGAVAAWTVLSHASAASEVVRSSEPLSIRAQRMYQALSDADVTATTAFLGGPDTPLAARQRYAADIARAAADLASLKGAATAAADPRLAAGLAAVSAGLPVYTGYVAQAQSSSALGYPLPGGSFMQVASEQMHLTLLPAARTVYTRQNAALAAASARATGLPWIAVVLGLAVVIGFVLYRVQRWLARRTHRVFNVGLVLASVVLVAVVLWLAAAFAAARSSLDRAVAHGSAPAEALAQAAIGFQQARGDQVLNLISRSGDATFVQDFRSVRDRLGPGPGTLLTTAAQASAGGASPAAARWTAAAARDAVPWYAVNERVYNLDGAADYAGETQLVIGTGPASSAAGFSRVEADLSRAIAADQVVFHRSATAGQQAFGLLGPGVIAAAVVMAAGCVWGLARRLAEYR